MPLNPKIAQVLDMVARSKRLPYYETTPAQARAAYEKSAPILDIARAPVYRVEDLRVPVRAGAMGTMGAMGTAGATGTIGVTGTTGAMGALDTMGATIRARLYFPFEPSWADPMPALVYCHGGGFTVGSVDTHDALCRMFARDARCAVLSVDYRLAPEHRFPGALDDVFDAYAWLHRHAATYGIDPARLALGGDSAGGTLATVCAVLARDAGIAPVFQLLICPGTCGHQSTASHAQFASGYLLSRELISWFFAQYLRDFHDRDDWRFAPLDGTHGAEGTCGARGAVPDFRGVASAWIATAEYDPLRDEGAAYAEKLRAAGNEVVLRCYGGMIHEFFKMGGFVPEVATAHADAAAALRGAFGISGIDG